MRLFSFLGLVLGLLMLVGCETSLYQYHDVAADPVLLGRHKVVQLYIDETFDVGQRKDLAAAIQDWNYALNNSMRLEVKTWSLKQSDQKATAEKINNTHQGIMILKYNSNDEDLKEYNISTGTVAFSLGVGDSHLIVVLEDRLGGGDLKVILEHELGHALGAGHVNSRQSLMFPYGEVPYAGSMQSPCIDKITLSQVSGYNHLDMKYLNYCSTEDFP